MSKLFLSLLPRFLNQCDDHLKFDKKKPQYNDQSLWNAMVNPLKWVSVKGFLWYQGERNTNKGYNRDKYQCTFPAMIQAWRQEFSSHSSTDPLAPFGFVQLGMLF